MRERPEKERKTITKSLRGKAALDAWDKVAVWIRPARRARVANAVTAALGGCADNPKALTWPDKYIELLGHSADRTDQRAVALLERFRAMAGESRRSEFETLDRRKEGDPARNTLHPRLVATHRSSRSQGAGGSYRAYSKSRG